MSLGQNPNIVDGFGNAVKADETGLHITAKPGTTATINGQAIQIGPTTHGPNDYAAVPDLALGDGAGGASILFDSVKAGSIVLTDGAGDAIELDGTSGIEITAGAGGLTLNGVPITPGGGVPNFADNEEVAGVVNGLNKTFTLAHTPNPLASLLLFVWKATLIMQAQGAGLDYTIVGNTITMAVAPGNVGPGSSAPIAYYRY